MMSSLRQKHDQAVFDNFRRNQGYICIQYYVNVLGEWHTINQQNDAVPECIRKLPRALSVEVDFLDQNIEDCCNTPNELFTFLRISSIQVADIIRNRIESANCGVHKFMSRFYSLTGSDDNLFVGASNPDRETHVEIEYGDPNSPKYIWALSYNELMMNLKGRMEEDPLRLSDEELADIIRYEEDIAATAVGSSEV